MFPSAPALRRLGFLPSEPPVDTPEQVKAPVDRPVDTAPEIKRLANLFGLEPAPPRSPIYENDWLFSITT